MFCQLSSPTYLLLTISSSLLSSLNTLNININLILNELKISQKIVFSQQLNKPAVKTLQFCEKINIMLIFSQN